MERFEEMRRETNDAKTLGMTRAQYVKYTDALTSIPVELWSIISEYVAISNGSVARKKPTGKGLLNLALTSHFFYGVCKSVLIHTSGYLPEAFVPRPEPQKPLSCREYFDEYSDYGWWEPDDPFFYPSGFDEDALEDKLDLEECSRLD